MLRIWFMIPLIWWGTACRKGTGGSFPPPPVCWPTSIQFYIMQPHKQVVNNYFRLVRWVGGRNRFQTLHFKETVVAVFVPLWQVDHTARLWNAMRRWVSVRRCWLECLFLFFLFACHLLRDIYFVFTPYSFSFFPLQRCVRQAGWPLLTSVSVCAWLLMDMHLVPRRVFEHCPEHAWYLWGVEGGPARVHSANCIFL